MLRIAVLGSQGVPAKYGGFETFIENIIEYKSSENKYTIFCSSRDYDMRLKEYKGAQLKYIPLHANGISSTLYDILSLQRVIIGYDAVLLLGVSGCIFLPVFKLFFKGKLIINIDGLEYKRSKWNRLAKQYLHLSESLAVKYADIIITDNKGIQSYVKENYKKVSEFIPYGGDQAIRDVDVEKQNAVLSQFNLVSGTYSLTICRIEPENNCSMILDAFVQTGEILVFIGNWDRNNYSRQLRDQFSKYSNIHLISSIYDLDILHAFRNNCKFYLHGHSAGGTNPALVEAMFFHSPILAYDVVYNRETTYNKAGFFKNAQDLISFLSGGRSRLMQNVEQMNEIAHNKYKWQQIAMQYEALYKKL